MSKGNKLIKVF